MIAVICLVALSSCASPQKTMTRTEQILVNERIVDNSFTVKGIGTVKQYPNLSDSLKPLKPLTIIELDTVIERKSHSKKNNTKKPVKKDTLSIKFNPVTNEFNVNLKAEPDTTADTTKIVTQNTEVVKEKTNWKELGFLMILLAIIVFLFKK